MKKLLNLLFSVLILFSVCAVSVSALGSISLPGDIGEWTGYDEEETEFDHEVYELVFDERDIEDIDRHDERLRNLMGSVNRGETTIKEYFDERDLDAPCANGKIGIFSEIRDLIVRNVETHEKQDAYDVTVTWEVPGLVEGYGQVYVYHNSTERGVDELIKPIDVNYAEKTVTAKFDDLSPVAVVYVQCPSKPVDTATNITCAPTDTNSNTGLYLGVAVVAGAALLVINRKKSVA